MIRRLSHRAQAVVVGLGLFATSAGLLCLTGCSSDPSPAPVMVFEAPAAGHSSLDMELDDANAERTNFGPMHYCTFTTTEGELTVVQKFLSRGPDKPCESLMSTRVTAPGDFDATLDLVLERQGRPTTTTDEAVLWERGNTTYTLTAEPLSFSSHYNEGELLGRMASGY